MTTPADTAITDSTANAVSPSATSGSILGNRVTRVEDDRFLRGEGTYVENLDLPNSAWLTYVRSTMAHAEISMIDIEEARTAPGVIAVFTGEDLAELGPEPTGNHPPEMVRWRIARDRVRYVGEPVVAVLAENRYAAADGAERVIIDYEPLDVVLDVHKALAPDATKLFPEAESNVALTIASDRPADFSDCEVVTSIELSAQRVAAAPLEGRSGAAWWGETEDGRSRLTHYTAAQTTAEGHKALSAMYDLEPELVRVVVPDMGGGFGAKGRTQGEELVLGWFARQIGRPVKWTETRTENMIALPHGRGQAATATIGGKRDGTITAYQLDMVQDGGAYPAIGIMLPMLTQMMMSGCYHPEHVGHTNSSVLTNAVPIGAYRGAGRPEAAHAIERAVDRFAAELGMDPADVRRENLIPAFDQPYATPSGMSYDTGNYPEALERLLAAADYNGLRAEQKLRREQNDPVVLGLGLSTYVEITSPLSRSEFGSTEIAGDGHIIVRTGSTPYGQGHVTTWAMIAADRLGVDMEDVEVLHGDTDEVASQGVTGGSRSVQLSGTAVANSSAKLIELAKERAADLLEAAVDDVVFDKDAGTFHVAGTPTAAVDWAALGASEGDLLVGTSDFLAESATFPFGAHLAVVEIDTVTGDTRLRNMHALDDAGTIINPLIAEGQRHGGIAQGVSQVLYEKATYDEDGNPITSNLADYLAVSATEMPMFDLYDMETPTFVNELGAKGIGESGTIGALPATHNAVIDALAHLGVRDMELPATPERVWRAISEAAVRQ